MRLDPYGFSRIFRLLLRFILICSIFSISYAQNEVEEPTEAPDTFQYRTGKLNQFKGFYTPRPFIPSNMDFSYGSIWATWSAWSFCANGVQVRVRACNTVRGFSCLGPNQERRPCGTPQPRTKFEPALHEQDYDAVDPYIEDRREAMKQLYSDYEAPKLTAPPKNPRRKPARRPISIGAPDSDFTIQSPDGKRNFHVVNPIASGVKTSCGYGNCNQGLAPPPRAPSSVDVKSKEKYQAPSLTPDQVYGKTKSPYEENPSGPKKSKKKHKIRGEKTQDIKEQEILEHLEVAENHVEETTATTKAEQLGNVEVAINVGRQKPSKPTSTGQEETDYFNGPDQNIDYEEDYGKAIKESIEETLVKNTNVEENEETEITQTTEETTIFTYPPTIRLKLVTAPPKGSKLRSLKKHRNEEVNQNVVTEIKETKAKSLTRATTQKPYESSILPTTTPPAQTHQPSPETRHPEIVEPKITYTSNFSAMPYPELFPRSEQNHIVSAVPLPPMFEIEGPMIELTGNTPFEEDKDDTHDVELSSGKQKSDAKIDKNEENHETTVTTESPKEREIIPNSEKMMIEGPVPGEEVLEVEKEAKKSSVTQQVRKNVHAGEIKFGKEIITEDTAKAIEWLLSNMTEAAKKQEQQQHNTQTQSKASFNQKVNEELAARIEAMNKNDASKKEVLHSGEVIIPNLHRANSGESKPRFLTRLHGTKIFKTTDKVVKIHEDEMENDGAHIFTRLTTTLNDKSVPESTKIEKSEHNLDETIATESSSPLSDTPRTTEAPRLPNHDGQLQYHTFRKKPTARKLIIPNIEATTETILQKPQETIFVSAETNDTKNIEAEILRLQKEMKEMESELNDLKNQEDSIKDEISEDEKVEEVTKIYPVINPKAYNLNLVPTGPKSESGPLPPIITRENSETFILGDMDMSEKSDAQWNEWSDWAECFCNKQVRTRSCNYESGYHSKGCVGKSYETRNCISIKPCPSVHTKKIKSFTSTLSPPSTFYTLAPPGRRRLGANFMMNQLSIAKLSKPLRSKSSSFHATTVRKFFHT